MLFVGFTLGLVLSLPFWLWCWAVAWRLAAFYVLIGLCYWRFSVPAGWNNDTSSEATELFAVKLGLGVVLVGFLARVIWQAWNRPAVGTVYRWVAPALLAMFAAFIGINATIALSWQMAGGAVLAAHGILGLAALGPLIVTFMSNNRLVTAAALGLSASLIAMLIYSAFLHPTLVLASAKKVAGGGDYCISLPMSHRAAHARSDLTFLTMDKSPAWRAVPHPAVVTHEGPVAYWSYHLVRFNPQTVSTRIAFCDPAGERGLVSKPDGGVAFVSLDAGQFVVPQAFAPLPSAGNHLAVSLDPMTGAPNPDGIPTAWIAFNEADSIDSLVTADRAVMDGPHGLEVLDLSADPYPTTTQVYLARDKGRVTTQIECWAAMCLNRFSPNGADRIIFNHDPEDLPQWRDMQDRVAALFENWRR